MAFDGARHFGHIALIIAGATLLSLPALGCWPVVGAVVALYYLLAFYNALEQRDLDDAEPRRSANMKSPKK
jgi:hypothetical protein